MTDQSNFLSSGQPLVQEGDTAVIYVNFGQAYAIQVTRGLTLAMKYGALRHEFLIGKPYGSKVSASAGYVHVLRPTPELWTYTLPHRTQILYSPDIALITTLLDLKPGSKVAESGTGSGSLSHAILRTIFPNGKLFTYDIDNKRVEEAKKEFQLHGFGNIVEISQRNVCEIGFGLENEVDAVFLDLPTPWEAIEDVKKALKCNNFTRFVAFSPCIEQVQRTCQTLRDNGFLSVETVELVPKRYKVTDTVVENMGWERTDETVKRMGYIPYPAQQPTHTGYLTSATLLPH